jgi:hypothetical protein
MAKSIRLSIERRPTIHCDINIGTHMQIHTKISQIILTLGICLAMFGCSKSSNTDKEIVIAPGQFVLDEPSKLSEKIKSSKRCSADTLNAKERSTEETWVIQRGAPIVLRGWAFSIDGNEAYPEVFVRLTGAAQTYYALTTSRHMRSDANQYLQINPSLAIGFELSATTDQIEPGIYEIMIMQRGSGDVEGCATGAMLIVN